MDHEKDGPINAKAQPQGQNRWWWHSLISRGLMFFNSVHLATIVIAAYIVMIQTLAPAEFFLFLNVEHLADSPMTPNTFRSKLERARRTTAI
jgi:hypothetical protein